MSLPVGVGGSGVWTFLSDEAEKEGHSDDIIGQLNHAKGSKLHDPMEMRVTRGLASCEGENKNEAKAKKEETICQV
jgi:hypothetical protein